MTKEQVGVAQWELGDCFKRNLEIARLKNEKTKTNAALKFSLVLEAHNFFL